MHATEKRKSAKKYSDTCRAKFITRQHYGLNNDLVIPKNTLLKHNFPIPQFIRAKGGGGEGGKYSKHCAYETISTATSKYSPQTAGRAAPSRGNISKQGAYR